MRKKESKGITLITLVITIIVLLILAGISIASLTGQNGILTKANKAKEEYKIAEAREKLALVLQNAGIEKRINIKYNQDDFLDEFIKNNLLKSKIKGDIVIVDEQAFSLDRSVPEIEEYLGEEKVLVFPSLEIEKQAEKNNDYVTLNIKAQESKNGINKIEIILDGDVVFFYDYEQEKNEINESYTTDKNGTYIIKAYSKLESTEIVEVKGVISPIVYEPNGSESYEKEVQVKVSVSEVNEKVKSIKYQWLKETKEPEKETFIESVPNGGTISTNKLTGKWYLWTLLETESGATKTGKSEAFFFDNEGPVVTLTSIAVSETSFTLIANAKDNEVKTIAKYEFYANGKLVGADATTGESASCTVSEMSTGSTECYVKVTDGLGNIGQSENYVASTKLYTWGKYSIIEKDGAFELGKKYTTTLKMYSSNGKVVFLDSENTSYDADSRVIYPVEDGWTMQRVPRGQTNGEPNVPLNSWYMTETGR